MHRHHDHSTNYFLQHSVILMIVSSCIIRQWYCVLIKINAVLLIVRSC